MKINLKQGQSLVEVIFIVGIVALILSGLVSGTIYFGRSARSAKYRSLAVSLAEEKLEELRAEKENNPASFWQAVAVHSSPIIENLTDPASFTRTTTFSDYQEIGSTKKVKVDIRVDWQDGEKTRQTVVSSYFTY